MVVLGQEAPRERTDRVERPPSTRFSERFLIDGPQVHPFDEIIDRRELTALFAHLDDILDGGLPTPLIAAMPKRTLPSSSTEKRDFTVIDGPGPVPTAPSACTRP